MSRQEVIAHVRSTLERIDSLEQIRAREERNREEFDALVLRGRARQMIDDPLTSETARSEARIALTLIGEHFPSLLWPGD